MVTLKAKLLETLKSTGRIDLNQLQALCNAYPAKTSYAERILRLLRDKTQPDYQPELSVELKNGYIAVYKWQEASKVAIPESVLKFQAEFNKPVVKENTLF